MQARVSRKSPDTALRYGYDDAVTVVCALREVIEIFCPSSLFNSVVANVWTTTMATNPQLFLRSFQLQLFQRLFGGSLLRLTTAGTCANHRFTRPLTRSVDGKFLIVRFAANWTRPPVRQRRQMTSCRYSCRRVFGSFCLSPD